MLLAEQPDFEHHKLLAEQSAYANYQNKSTFFLVPSGLEIGTTKNNTLDFSLTLIRSHDDASYGRLDFRVTPSYQMGPSLQQLRETDPTCVLRPLRFESGYLRFHNTDSLVPQEITEPVSLTWDGLGVARYCIYLSAASATLLKKNLNDDTVNFIAYADMEFRGVSPRLPLTIECEPQVLVTQLCALAEPEHSEQRIVSYDAIVKYFQQDISQLPCKIFSGNIATTKSALFCHSMTDRVRMAFAEFVSVPNSGQHTFVQFPDPKKLPKGRVSWVLSDAFSALRPVCLALNPFEAAQQLIKDQGAGAVISEVTVPKVEYGYQTIKLATSLPAALPANVLLGVNLSVSPDLPLRPQKQTKTIQINAKKTLYEHTFFFATEHQDIQFDYQPYAVVIDNKGAHTLQGKQQSCSRSLLYVGPQSFPVTFTAIEATGALMKIATFKGQVNKSNGDTVAFELTAQQPSINLALMTISAQDTIEGQAVSLDGKHCVQLPSQPVGSITIGQYSFSEYGFQEVSVVCHFQNSQEAILIEFQGEGEKTSQRRFFSSDNNQQHFGWNTVSIFKCRYRYKVPGKSWSNYLAPHEPLQITV